MAYKGFFKTANVSADSTGAFIFGVSGTTVKHTFNGSYIGLNTLPTMLYFSRGLHLKDATDVGIRFNASTFSIECGCNSTGTFQMYNGTAGVIFSATSTGDVTLGINTTATVCRVNGKMAVYSTGQVERFYVNANATPGIFADSTILTSGAGTNAVKWNSGTGLFTYDSSSRLIKSNIEPLKSTLSSVLKMSPCIYNRTDSEDVREIGFIADEVVEIFPELVSFGEKKMFTRDENDTEMIPASVDYARISAILVRAIQELKAEVDDLRAQMKLPLPEPLSAESAPLMASAPAPKTARRAKA